MLLEKDLVVDVTVDNKIIVDYENPPIPDWQPNPNWWDIKSVISSDRRNFPGKVIFLFYNFSDTSTFVSSASNRLRAIETSDGAYYEFDVPETAQPYEQTIKHTWDTSKDKDDGTGKKTRWVMYFFDNKFRYGTGTFVKYITFNGGGDIGYGLDNNCIAYAIVRHQMQGDRFFSYNPLLECIEYSGNRINYSSDQENAYYMEAFLTNCVSLQSIKTNQIRLVGQANNVFAGLKKLRKIPNRLFDFADCDGANGFCNECSSLEEVPENLFTLWNGSIWKPTGQMANLFRECVLLKSVPVLDTSLSTTVLAMYSGCKSLTKINHIIDVSSCTVMPSQLFAETSITELPQIVGFENMPLTVANPSVGQIFYNIPLLKKIPFKLDFFKPNYGFSGVVMNCPMVEELDIGEIMHVNKGISQTFQALSSLVRVKGVIDLTSTTQNTASSQVIFRNSYNLQEAKIILPPKDFWLVNDRLTPESYRFLADNAPDVTASPRTLHVGAFKLNELQNNSDYAGILDTFTAKGWRIGA